MKTTLLAVKSNGIPLANAQVCFGEYLKKWVTANENGVVSSELPDDFAAILNISVRHQSVGTTMGSTLLIEAGGNYTLDLVTL